jgi:hypothetical protein
MKQGILVLLVMLFTSCNLFFMDLEDTGLTFNTPEEIRSWVLWNIRYKTDTYDCWQTPALTVSRGIGDCEDFAILIMYELKKIGISSKLIAMSYGDGTGHALVEYNSKLIDSTSSKDYLFYPTNYKVYSYDFVMDKARRDSAFER